MSIFNPYPNKPYLTICCERYRLFRIYILAVGVISLLNCIFIAAKSNFSIFYSAYLPYLTFQKALDMFNDEKIVLGIILCVAAIAVCGFYIFMYFTSSRKYSAGILAFAFFIIDSIIMVIKIKSVGLEFIIGHIIILILFSWGILTVKRLVQAENEHQKENLRN